jgi:hypothetical protein
LLKGLRGKPFVTDKMPQNFRYIALICAAFPEAKIVHVQRTQRLHVGQTSSITSLQKPLAIPTALRYSCNTTGYTKELMHFWSQSYSRRIYNLDYDKLTEGPRARNKAFD